MAITKKARINKAPGKVTAATTYDGNGGTVDVLDAEQDLTNHFTADRLKDPEDDTSFDTHFSNEGEFKTRKVTAGADQPVTDDQNVGTICNEQDPAAGYLPGADGASNPDADADGINDVIDTEVEAGSTNLDNAVVPTQNVEITDLTNNDLPDPLTADADEELEDDEDEDEDENWDTSLADPDMSDDIEEEEFDEDVEGDDEDEEFEEGINESVNANDELPLVDVDGFDDSMVDDVNLATAGTKVWAIKANRIIATLTKKQAVKANVADTYLRDQFAVVVASEMESKGLRKGLLDCGFVLATVNVKSNQVVAKLVEKETHKTMASVRSANANKDKVFQQSLAIASVGINKKLFDSFAGQHVLKAALTAELEMAGMRGANRLVAKVFNEHGAAFVKQLLAVAEKIAAFPEEVRDGYAESLDITDAMDEEDDLYGEPDLATDELDDFDSDVEEIEDSTSVASTLATAGYQHSSRKSKAVLLNANAMSSDAQAILAGKKLF